MSKRDCGNKKSVRKLFGGESTGRKEPTALKRIKLWRRDYAEICQHDRTVGLNILDFGSAMSCQRCVLQAMKTLSHVRRRGFWR
ncbi:hypothetical protein IG631_03518 [Alternaria alternata]|nr:hypothetical protein IG631_03518 [Alternaria alternata]